ncbi:unnamed protein product [Pleuronectes platessa]|uniref:Uncharacterized protein n=1 Tax=Pleuronectes platessa TaxID=8262 RepID=A0A9N7V0M4_PLEPL|nr:unnamed protein product [Pleuronectes platessa]
MMQPIWSTDNVINSGHRSSPSGRRVNLPSRDVTADRAGAGAGTLRLLLEDPSELLCTTPEPSDPTTTSIIICTTTTTTPQPRAENRDAAGLQLKGQTKGSRASVCDCRRHKSSACLTARCPTGIDPRPVEPPPAAGGPSAGMDAADPRTHTHA